MFSFPIGFTTTNSVFLLTPRTSERESYINENKICVKIEKIFLTIRYHITSIV